MRRALDPIEWISALVFLCAMVVLRIGDRRECRRYERTELRLRKRHLLPPDVAPHGTNASDLAA